MEIECNGRKDIFQAPPDSPLGEILRELRFTLARASQVVAEVALDGEPLTEDRETELGDRPTGEFRLLSVATVAAGDLVRRILSGLGDHVDSLAEKSRAIGRLFQSGKRQEGLKTVDGLLADLASFTNGIHVSFTYLGEEAYGSIERDLETFRAFLERMNGIVGAQEDVEFADLLLYELPENLESWRGLLAETRKRLAPSHEEKRTPGSN